MNNLTKLAKYPVLNESKKYVSFTVGGAITSLAVPENEYEECLVKAKAMLEVLK